MTKSTSVSLAAELDELADVIESAQLLAELLATNALPHDDAVSRAPKMLESVLALAAGRVRLLRKVVVGAADAALIENRNNRAFPAREGDDPDVVLPAPHPRRR